MVAEAACHIIVLVLAPISVAADQASGLFAPTAQNAPNVGRFVIAPEISAVSVAMLPVTFTMSVGIAPGVTPSGEPPPSWEPVYTLALLIARRCS